MKITSITIFLQFLLVQPTFVFAQLPNQVHIYKGQNKNILAFCAIDESKPHQFAFKFYPVHHSGKTDYLINDFKKYITENPNAYFNSQSFQDTVAIYESHFHSFIGTNRYYFSILFNASKNEVLINKCVGEGSFRSPIAERTVLRRIK